MIEPVVNRAFLLLHRAPQIMFLLIQIDEVRSNNEIEKSPACHGTVLYRHCKSF